MTAFVKFLLLGMDGTMEKHQNSPFVCKIQDGSAEV